MKLMWKRSLVSTFTKRGGKARYFNAERFTDKRTNQKHEIRTVKLEHEPNLFFEKRHELKIKAKKYWLSKIIK